MKISHSISPACEKQRKDRLLKVSVNDMMTFMNPGSFRSSNKAFSWTWLEAQEVLLTQEKYLDLKGVLVSIFSLYEQKTQPFLSCRTLHSVGREIRAGSFI